MAVRGILILGLLALACLASLPKPANAQQSGREAMFQDWMGSYQSELISAGQVLASKSQSDWTQEEVESYLFNALFAIYNANNIYIERNRQHPYDAEMLRESRILTPWPENPLNAWEPISWSAGAGDFVPGDIVLQLCPVEWYSGFDRLIPLTYVLTINGPSATYTPIQDPNSYPIEPIYDWDTVPPGTAFMTTSYYEPASKTRPKLEQARKAKAERESKP